jgi:hypothetical protein
VSAGPPVVIGGGGAVTGFGGAADPPDVPDVTGIGGGAPVGDLIPVPIEVPSSTNPAPAARVAGMPWGGVPPLPNFLGDVSRGSSAPHPKQNL